jgi:hypothetical protein
MRETDTAGIQKEMVGTKGKAPTIGKEKALTGACIQKPRSIRKDIILLAYRKNKNTRQGELTG